MKTRKPIFALVYLLFFVILTIAAISIILSRIDVEKPPPAPEPSTSVQPADTEKTAYYEDFDKGLSYLKQGKYADAVEFFKKAVLSDPDNIHSRYYLMLAASRIEEVPYGRDSQTAVSAKAIIAKAPLSDMADTARALLQRIPPTHATVTEKPTPKPTALSTPEPGKTPSASPPVKIKAKTDPSYYPKAAKRPAKTKPELKSAEREASGSKKAAVTATLKGSVSRPDEKGRVFSPAGIDIYLINLTGSDEYRARTDSTGNFVISGITPAQSYVLVVLSPLAYRGLVEERYPVPMPPVMSDRDQPADSDKNSEKKIEYDPEKGKEDQENFFSRKAPRLMTGDGFIYYPPTAFNYIPYQDYFTNRIVEMRLDYSWHLRIHLDRPGTYSVELNDENNDDKYLPMISPKYDPIGMKAYPQLNDITPVRTDDD